MAPKVKPLKRSKGESKADFKARKARVEAKRAKEAKQDKIEEQAAPVANGDMPLHPTLGVPFVPAGDPNLMTKKQAAEFLHVSETTVAAYAKRGELKSLIPPNERNRKNPSRMYYKPHLEEFKTNQSVFILYEPEPSAVEIPDEQAEPEESEAAGVYMEE